ncbi:SURF1 family protein [Lichenihabitans sp. Uapishka_5]|uniref:SURF1 family protein n=1 Tax=Lichenihabitans sp. Uapishka_5 TaxID=3037302 RepID=UPI0029E7F07E|nr:SURF1 family protein [Lichenihabitans sp. Uapishka_5]MDX7950893.1 SURF1 family protein [Lichenihabitans sp. Uapishka_5]
MPREPAGDGERARSTGSLVGLGAVALSLIVVLLGLGTWQMVRRVWKLDLIARVEARVHAAPAAAPGPDQWKAVTASGDEYRHVTLTGTFLNADETLTQAVTDYGPGFWVIVPLRAASGMTVLVNRGFVPSDRADPASRPDSTVEGETTVTGLLRLPEPHGGFLRNNDPATNRWYSRDVAAIAAAHDLGPVAPYFIDADGPPDPSRLPVGGLTVVHFPNNHLVYALTWYSLAAMLAAAVAWIGRDEWKRRSRRTRSRALPFSG